MQVFMHSSDPLPLELRSSFELPVWPYREGPGNVPTEFRDYLKQYTIFRYLDDEADHPSAILVPNSEGEWPHNWESPIDCYEHIVYIHDDTLEVGTWPNDQNETKLHEQIVAKTGDNYSWGSFNKKVSLHRVDQKILVYIDGHNRPANVARHGKIQL